jgi:hypothetical protein
MFGNIANISAFFAGKVEAMCTSSLQATFEKRGIVAIELCKRRIPTAKICCHAVTLSLAPPDFPALNQRETFSRPFVEIHQSIQSLCAVNNRERAPQSFI